jgi:SNF2 family DNA or RNA helicase
MPELLEQRMHFAATARAASFDSRYLNLIKKRIAPFLLRRVKNQVAQDLPELIDQVVWIEMSEAQRSLYDNFLASFRSNLLKKVRLEGMSAHRMEAFEALLRLRQICCHPLLLSMAADPVSESAKLETLMQDLASAKQEGRKAVIYSQFTSMLRLIAKELDERQWSFAYLDGHTRNREAVVDQFQRDSTVSFFLVSLKAGGVGLNLTSADYVMLYDPWWNEAVEQQAINRAHRIGRKEIVHAKRYVIAESIEERMLRLKSSKRALAEDLLAGEDTGQTLTQGDLEYLLS